jgi:thiamine-phosphate pyrophosphorylase
MEEYLRHFLPAESGKFEAFRYQLYDAEQWLVLTAPAASVLKNAQVYVLLTEAFCTKGVMATAKAVLKGGVRLIQFREKEKSDKTYLRETEELVKLCTDQGAILICNDRLDCALASGAAGVHLGQDDLVPQAVRRVAGERLLIGRSTHSLAEVQRAIEGENADYIAVGAMYKPGAKPDTIISGLCLAEEANRLQSSSIGGVPIFAIGGITLERIKELKAVGVNRVAVSTSIIANNDPETVSRRFVEAMSN